MTKKIVYSGEDLHPESAAGNVAENVGRLYTRMGETTYALQKALTEE